jgi:hypothetical protein
VPDEPEPQPPAALLAAAGCVLLEGAILGVYAVVDAFHSSSQRLVLDLTAVLFFVAYGVALGFCAWGLRHARRWSRGPVLFTQLVMLGFAWNFGQAHRWTYVVVLVVLAVLTLGCLLQPGVVHALEEGGEDWGE